MVEKRKEEHGTVYKCCVVSFTRQFDLKKDGDAFRTPPEVKWGTLGSGTSMNLSGCIRQNSSQLRKLKRRR